MQSMQLGIKPPGINLTESWQVSGENTCEVFRMVQFVNQRPYSGDFQKMYQGCRDNITKADDSR